MIRPIAVLVSALFLWSAHAHAQQAGDRNAALDYLAVPVLAPEAYLRATVTNGSPLLLLPGRARIFKDGQFTGETALDTVAPGEEFELQLGVDDQIRIERKLIRQRCDEGIKRAKAKGTKFGRRSVLDHSQRKKIAERYANGETMAALALDYGCSEPTIWRVLHP